MEPIVFTIEERQHLEFKDEAIGKSFSEIKPQDLGYVPFGKDYAGNFVLRHPNLGDRPRINAAVKRAFLKAGYTEGIFPKPGEPLYDMQYGFAVCEILAEEKPAWFDETKLSTDLDQHAVIEVGRAFDDAVEQKKKKSTETLNSDSSKKE